MHLILIVLRCLLALLRNTWIFVLTIKITITNARFHFRWTNGRQKTKPKPWKNPTFIQKRLLKLVATADTMKTRRDEDATDAMKM